MLMLMQLVSALILRSLCVALRDSIQLPGSAIARRRRHTTHNPGQKHHVYGRHDDVDDGVDGVDIVVDIVFPSLFPLLLFSVSLHSGIAYVDGTEITNSNSVKKLKPSKRRKMQVSCD